MFFDKCILFRFFSLALLTWPILMDTCRKQNRADVFLSVDVHICYDSTCMCTVLWIGQCKSFPSLGHHAQILRNCLMSWSNVYRVPLANTKYERNIIIFMLWLHLSHNCVHGKYTLLCNTCSANVFAFGGLTLSWELPVQSKSLFACPKGVPEAADFVGVS